MIKVTPIKNDQWFHSLVLKTLVSIVASIFLSACKLIIADIAGQGLLNVYMLKIRSFENSL